MMQSTMLSLSLFATLALSASSPGLAAQEPEALADQRAIRREKEPPLVRLTADRLPTASAAPPAVDPAPASPVAKKKHRKHAGRAATEPA